MPTEPVHKKPRGDEHGSGGDLRGAVAEKLLGQQFTSDDVLVSSKENSMEEPPNGETPDDLTMQVEEETPKGETPDVFTEPASKPADLSASQCRRDFTGFSIEDLYVIEICAGSARLSKTAHIHGFRTMAVDHTTTRTCGFPICVFDLTDCDSLQSLLDFIEESADSILMVWIAPSCGTCSRAREKRLPELEARGGKVPKPLRSVAQPDHLDGLSGVNKIKVEKANMLYDAVLAIAVRAAELHIFCAIENPTNSHYWSTTPMQTLCSKQQHHYVTFHNCAHGGDRDKATSLWVNDDWLDELALMCDRKHKHKPWTSTLNGGHVKFATSSEAAYPWLLCERIINCVKRVALEMGAHAPETLAEQAEGPTKDKLTRIVLGALPRGHKVKPLVSEFGDYVQVLTDPQRPSLLDEFLQKQLKGARIVSRRMVKGDNMQAAPPQGENHVLGDIQNCDVLEKVSIGIPSSPDDFIDRAKKAGHPRALDQFVDPQIQDMLRSNFSGEPLDLAKKRIAFFHKYLQRAKLLSQEEEQLRQTMPPHVRALVGEKRLVLWKEILSDLHYPDATLIDEIAEGFKLSGWMERSGVFKTRTKRPSMSMATLKKLAPSLNCSTFRSMSVRQEPELECATWTETVEEEKKGWIWFDPDESESARDQKFIGRRFGIKQSEKTRVIDDCSCCGLNWTVGLHEKFQLQSIDVLASMVSAAFKMSPGQVFPEILGRCYDLKAAYKQFAVHSGDRAVLRMAVQPPDEAQPKLIGFNALPFGAVGSVSGFLRVSMAVWYIGIAALHLCWTAFYDDFGVLSRKELLSNTSWTVESLFQLLGLKYATEGKKFLPFDSAFKMLGLKVDLSKSQEKEIAIGHTPDRREELRQRIDDILAAGSMDQKDAERLRGRMVFFEGFAFGRLANAAVKNLGRFCNGKEDRRSLDDSIRYSLLVLRDRVLSAPPLKVGIALTENWLVFTDGACSPERREGSVGGLVIDPLGNCRAFFSGQVPADLTDLLFKESANPIHELEVLPVVVACMEWGTLFSSALVVYYIDNESARMAFIRGSGETHVASILISEFVEQESACQHKTWFGRCPSSSNPADGASRLDLSWFERKFVEQTSINWERLRHLLGLRGELAGWR